MKSIINIPNLITFSRIVLLIPYFILLYFYNNWICQFTALIILIIAGITDFLDGFIARKLNVETDFGKFFDPLADKIFIISVLIGIMYFFHDLIPLWMVILLLIRELTISDFRLFSYSSNKNFRTVNFAKIKTALLFVTIIISNLIIIIESYLINIKGINSIVSIYPVFGKIIYYIPSFFLIIALYFAFHSGIIYLFSNISSFYKNERK